MSRRYQKSGYPDLAPIQLALPPDQAFARAKAVAESMPGWQVTNADSETGRIEATATSRVFHFVDDIVIRVRPDAGGSRIDMRSRSRDGLERPGRERERVRAFDRERSRSRASGALSEPFASCSSIIVLMPSSVRTRTFLPPM